MTALSGAGPRAQLSAAVSELNDLVLLGDLTDPQIEELTESVRALLLPAERRAGWWDLDEPGTAYRARSPFCGAENPRSPAMTIEFDHGASMTARGHVSLGPAFAGPPGAVHGGVLSGLFDELCGALAGQARPGRVLVTGRLTVRYRRPTPIRAPLALSAQIESEGTRRLLISAECSDTAGRTAQAEALMVVR